MMSSSHGQHSSSSNSNSNFDENKAYQQQEEVFFDDGREIELLHFVYSRPNLSELRGSPEKVLAAIDEYGRTRKYLMNVGDDKGRIVTELIAEVKPKVMVSLSRIPSHLRVCVFG
jgi:catechol O-methyltransferase